MSTITNKLCEIDPVVRYKWRIKPLIKTAIKEVSGIVRTAIGAGLKVTLFYKTDATETEVKNELKIALLKYYEEVTIDDFIFQRVIQCTPTVLY